MPLRQFISCNAGAIHRGLKSDIAHVRKVPCVDGSGLARGIFTSQAWSVLPCVRPLGAVHMTAGHNALRGSGPVNNPHSMMRWHKWVVLIAGSPGSALRAVRAPNLHITPVFRRDLVGERDGGDLGRASA